MWKLSLFIFITLTSLSHSFSLTSLKDKISHAYDNIFSFVHNIDVTKFLHEEQHPKSMNSSELIAYHNHTAEEYTVTTKDGYILRLFRIPGKGPAVLIGHGLFSSSDDFLVLGPKSLPIKLAVLGYDVWLCNFRGNFYSRNHQTISPDDIEFWDYSWHEFGTQDLPTTVDVILEKTSKSQLAYVAHSVGTTAGYVMLSEKPEYNDKINGMVSLSSVSFAANIPSPVFQLLAKNRKSLEPALKDLGMYELMPRSAPITSVMAVCGSSSLLSTLCLTALFPLFGFDYDQIDYESTDILFGHFPSGSSLMELLHYLQNIESGLFQKYDYGSQGNRKKYGCEAAQSYDVEKISAKMSFIYSDNDWLSNFSKDVQQLIDRLRNVYKVYKVELKSFNHGDFLYGKDADTLVYPQIIELLNEYTGGVQ